MNLRSSPIDVKLDKSGIYVFESRHAPGFEMELGKWDFDKLCFIRKGNGAVLVSAADPTPVKEDDILYIPTGISHKFEDDPASPITLVMICFYRDALGGHPSTAAASTNFNQTFPTILPLSSNRTHRRSAILTNLRRMVFEQTTAREGSNAVIWGLLSQLLVMLTRSANEVSARASHLINYEAFEQTLDFLEERFTEPLQIKDLAVMAGLSYRRYTTLFKESKGVTVNAYLTQLRLNYAKKRLSESGNVLFSSLESGFADLSHFYRVFKKETGMTPKQFMEKNI